MYWFEQIPLTMFFVYGTLKKYMVKVSFMSLTPMTGLTGVNFVIKCKYERK